MTIAVLVQARRPGRFSLASEDSVSFAGQPFAPDPQDLRAVARVGGLGAGGGLGARTRVFVQTCARSPEPILARPPSRQAARAGRPRVRLRTQPRRCTPRRQLSRAAARRALRLPAVAKPPGPFAPPLPACPLAAGAQGDLLGRRSSCSRPAVLTLTAFVIIASPGGGVSVEVVGTGVIAVVRRFELERRRDPLAVTSIGFQGLTGILRQRARIGVESRCEFAFATRCFADGRDHEIALATGTVGEARARLRVAALNGDLDFATPWTRLELRGVPRPVLQAAGGDPRPAFPLRHGRPAGPAASSPGSSRRSATRPPSCPRSPRTSARRRPRGSPAPPAGSR